MNYLTVVVLLIAFCVSSLYSKSLSISYSSQTLNGKTVFTYNGKNYNSMEEMKTQINKDIADFQGSSQTSSKQTNNNQEDNSVSGVISKKIWNGYDYNSDSRSNFQDMKRRFLEESNEYRRIHNVSSLTLDPNLAAKAQKYAEYIASINMLKHDPKNHEEGTGENLASGSSSISYQSVKWWYDEIKDYDFENPGFRSGTGHFTQLVWKNTTKVGFGVAESNGMTFVVAKYSPPGNFMGEFDKNVFPATT